MSLCSNCRKVPAIVRLGSCVLCGCCFEGAWHARVWRSRNLRGLPQTRHSLINRMRRMFVREELERRRVRCGNDANSPISLPARGITEGGRNSFFAQLRSGLRNLPNLFRGFFQPGRA